MTSRPADFLSPVLACVMAFAFYGRFSGHAAAALGLSVFTGLLLAGMAYFMRLWLPGSVIRFIVAAAAALAAQLVWTKLQLGPWWALAVLGLVLPAVENLRAPGRFQALLMQLLLLTVTALFFFLVRTLLEASPSRFFWEHPAGLFALAALLGSALSLLDRKGQGPV